MSVGAEPPRHADRRLDEAGLRAAALLEAALEAIVTPAARARFAPLRAAAAELRDASGLTLRRSAVAVRASLGPGDGLADHADPRIVAELREAIDEVLRVLTRRAAHRSTSRERYDA